MRIVVAGPEGGRELALAVEDDRATVADLLATIGTSGADAITVDGRVVPADHTIAEAAIVDGATVVPGRVPRTPISLDRATATHRVAVVAGTTSGDAVPLDRAVVVGRAPGCELQLSSTTVSEQHCRIVDDGRGEVTVTDLGSTNGTWVDGRRVPTRDGLRVPPGAVVRCGAVALRIEAHHEDDRPRSIDPLRHRTAAGTVPFNRPPRPAPPAPTPPVTALPPAPVEGEPPVFNLTMILAPLVMGAVMVVVLQDLRFALFVLLSPLMLLANTVTERRRSGRDAKRDAREHAAAVERFVEEVTDRQAVETRRRWAVHPSVAELRRRASQPSTRLWERRRRDDDQLVLAVGVGSTPFRPAVVAADGRAGEVTPLAREVLAAAELLPDAPVPVDLSHGGVVGIVGDRTAAVAAARSLLLQSAVLHGPADLPVAAVVDGRAVGDWGWVPWLPHTAGSGPDAPRRVAVAGEQAEALLRGLLDAEQLRRDRERAAAGVAPASTTTDQRPDRPTLLVVLDAPSALRGRDAAARAVLRGDAGPVAGIVVAATEDELPAVCDTVVTCASADGDGRLVRPSDRLLVPDLLVAGVSEQAARSVARRLAGLEDPEVTADGGRLPTRVDLLELLDLAADGSVTPAEIAATWAATAGSASVSTPIGVARDGAFTLDLVEDGPHGLLGGTTGSGKSELLRSLVAGLAARHDPDHQTFVLVDYKGGAAFDVCADLPHVVGLVTDLDEHLGERALRCLEAELEHRERRLRACGVSDLPQWLRLPDEDRGSPLPRLLVVVDEFATLKAELPDFVDALVGIAQRGRSLGVHMLLGTQRPSGAVDENVRANSNARIALRVTDRQDSSDVVGVPDAAEIPPSLPGRGVVRIGPGAVVPVQTALVTGRSGRRSGPPVRVFPLRFGPGGTASSAGDGDESEGPSDLARLVEACAAAFVAAGSPPPRRPWPEPLPTELPLVDVLAAAALGDTAVPVALVDLPDQQAQRPGSWQLDSGPLLVHGVVGSGTTTTAATCVLAACALHGPDDLHVQVLDLGRGGLAPLAGLPHAGAVVAGREAERRRRLLAAWVVEADRRRAMTAEQLAATPRLVLVIDGLDALLAELDDPATYEVGDALLRVLAESAGLRISPVLTSTRAGGLRSTLTAAVEQRWTHRLADQADHALLGLRAADVPVLGPGRAVRVADARELQVATAGDLTDAVAWVAARWPDPVRRTPASVEVLPTRVGVDELETLLDGPTHGRWRLPVGRREHDLRPAVIPLHRGEHPVLFGGPGSGRSGVLGAIGVLARRAGVEVAVVAGSRTSPLLGDGHPVVDPSALGELLGRPRDDEDRLLVLVDDAARVPDPGPALEELAGDGARVHLVVAVRPEFVQADFGHWVRRAARGRVGAFLRPLADQGGDLLGARLPRRAPAVVTPTRGWLVAAGGVEFVQFVSSDAEDGAG